MAAGPLGVNRLADRDHLGQINLAPIDARRRIESKDSTIEAATKMQDERRRICSEELLRPFVQDLGPHCNPDDAIRIHLQPWKIIIDFTDRSIGKGVPK